MFTIKKTKKFTFLKSKIKNKDILHVGCCGIVKKIEIENEKNNYLHKFLNDNSNKCYGLSDGTVPVKVYYSSLREDPGVFFV